MSTTLRIAGIGSADFIVHAVRGDEGINRLYKFDVSFRSTLDLHRNDPTLLGVEAALELEGRTIAGIITKLEGDRAPGVQARLYTARIAPPMWRLKKRKDSRIFQDMTAPDIIRGVLGRHRVGAVFNLAKEARQRAYVVQYRETDLAFVTRLAAEMGAFFYFDAVDAPSDDPLAIPGVQVVFVDSASAYPVLDGGPFGLPTHAVGGPAPLVPFRAKGTAMESGFAIQSFGFTRAIQPHVVALRDYDFERPLLDLRASEEADPDAPKSASSTPENGVRAPMSTATLPNSEDLEVYEHHGEYVETDVSTGEAKTKLEQLRSRAILAKGTSNCASFNSGRRFALEGTEFDVEVKEYVLVRIKHRYRVQGDSTGAQLENEFECVPASVPYRPALPVRDLSHVLESATVVGPGGAQVHTDKHGRIRVEFHWDRESDHKASSCWMRVSQAWAGASFGFQFLPRVGTEVLVSFLGGDEDKPVVIGSVYNATSPPPFPLPDQASKSGIKTSTINGEGGNELSFDDVAGGEMIRLKAQRDFSEQVVADHTVDVGGEAKVNIAHSQHVRVGGERHDTVALEESRVVGGVQNLTVGGNQLVAIGGRRAETVHGMTAIALDGQSVFNHGNSSAIIEGHASMSIGTEEQPTSLAFTVTGDLHQSVSQAINLTAEKRITLSVGGSAITLGPDVIRIDAKQIVLHAAEKLTLLGNGPGIELGNEAHVLADKILMFSKGGSIELDSEAAHVDGPLVKLNCGPGTAPEIEDEAEKPEMQDFHWRCLDKDRKPYKHKAFRLTAAGFRKRGFTDSEGLVDESVPLFAQSAELTLWIDSYPEGRRLVYPIRLGRLPATDSVFGAVVRLTNLGYYNGPTTDVMTDELGAALYDFQFDNGLPTSAKLDDATVDKLDAVHN